MKILWAILFLFVFLPISSFAASLQNYDVSIADGVFTPSSIEVSANQRIKITIKNTGKGPAEFENLSLRVEKVLGPGVTSFVVIHPLKPGKYQFIDEFHMNMQGFSIISK
ncbi:MULTISPECIES: cupredoxin domain-containing protein [Commensalibacter]|uniref:Periplasmic lipoprotein involved in iron transport n=2 Tax=Commensalibacter TaxID=1079922 RepID=W7DR77_9PROT|nr:MULTISPECIES: cupredoxin domain-containing protein [Commensalibacter]EUK17410.1 periplasmic lipoprotein involved in iron transport [Commensalibacter papalotli (ex Servin-Garciduenas et al. 2014)]CAI3957355.1 Iron uptake system EfeUOB [Commensalibacter papalotli (ex Botero et al. 2024)]CAI3957799.1 Iron uptake system EfeUOB [Commensalibacter papalotli (ex Botero et al. 2024)]